MDNVNLILQQLHESKEWKQAKVGTFTLQINDTKRWVLEKNNCFGVELSLEQFFVGDSLDKSRSQWSPFNGPQPWEGGYTFRINTMSLHRSEMVGHNTTMAINTQIYGALNRLYDQVLGLHCDYQFLKLLEFIKS